MFGTRVPAWPGESLHQGLSRRGRHVPLHCRRASPLPRSRHRPSALAQLVFAVTEGVTYQATPKEIREKFEPLAEVIGRALRREVRIVLVPGYDDARAGLAKQEFDLAYVHPAHVALAEVKAGRYERWSGPPASPTTRCRCSSSPIRR